MARLIKEGSGPPLVRKEIISQYPANVISSQPSPMVIREGAKLLFHNGPTCFYNTLILFT
jgi:hypothetical protein